jgi:hypothetical protein
LQHTLLPLLLHNTALTQTACTLPYCCRCAQDKIKKKLEAARLETADEAGQALFAEQQLRVQELEVELVEVVAARDIFKNELKVVQDELLQLRASHDALLAEQAERQDVQARIVLNMKSQLALLTAPLDVHRQLYGAQQRSK